MIILPATPPCPDLCITKARTHSCIQQTDHFRRQENPLDTPNVKSYPSAPK